MTTRWPRPQKTRLAGYVCWPSLAVSLSGRRHDAPSTHRTVLQFGETGVHFAAAVGAGDYCQVGNQVYARQALDLLRRRNRRGESRPEILVLHRHGVFHDGDFLGHGNGVLAYLAGGDYARTGCHTGALGQLCRQLQPGYILFIHKPAVGGVYMKLSSWGRYPVIEARTHSLHSVDALRELVLHVPSLIARGKGCAYSDSTINTSATIETCHLNQMTDFDSASGQLFAESGVLIGDIIATLLPRGWFPIVTSVTKFVTLGGAIAADDHRGTKPQGRHDCIRGGTGCDILCGQARLSWDGQQFRPFPGDSRGACNAQRFVTGAGASTFPGQAQAKTGRSQRPPCPHAEPSHRSWIQRPLLPGRSTQDGRTVGGLGIVTFTRSTRFTDGNCLTIARECV